MEELFNQKYDTDKFDEDTYLREQYKHNGYGFIYIKNPGFPIDDDREYLLRKPTPKERREIVINTVIECNGRTFKVHALAQRLAVSDRTIQTILRQLQKDKLIQITPRHNKNGKQIGNAYKYIGPPCESYGTGLTLKALYSTEQDVGFRDWAWKTHGFDHDQAWHNIYPMCKAKFERRLARKEYLEENGLPLVVPEDIKYIVLRYCYWKGEKIQLYDENLFSQDKTIKLPLEPFGRTEAVNLFGIPLIVKINGPKENPYVTLIDANTNKKITVFSWFDENVILGDCEIDEEHADQIFIIGDFVTR